MKIPFSYQTGFFRPVFAGVLIAHGVLMFSSGIGSPLPEAGLQMSRTSMEIVILEQPAPIDIPEPVEEVLTAREDAPAPPSEIPARAPEPVKEILPERVTPAEQGVLQEPSPDYLLNPPPVYPDYARERGWQGTVLLEVHVTSSGFSEQVTVLRSSGYRILDQAAEKAVRGWKFKPASFAGTPLSAKVKVPVRFILEKAF